jgi:hypothetical protein
MSTEFQREYLLQLSLSRSPGVSRAYNAKDVRGQHDSTFYLFEAPVELVTAPAVAVCLHEVP